MSKKIFLVALLSFIILVGNQFTLPVQAAENASPASNEAKVEYKSVDKRTKILAAYLSQFNSPLQNFAQDFIDVADKYEMDWKLVPAIAGVESTFGKFIPGGQELAHTSYNAWGWGAATADSAIYFESWKDGINTVAKGLKERYLNKGLTDPFAMNKVYAASPTWGTKVAYYLGDIEKFAQKYEVENPEGSKVETTAQTAAVSGQLANN